MPTSHALLPPGFCYLDEFKLYQRPNMGVVVRIAWRRPQPIPISPERRLSSILFAQ